ncbi:outer membrane porin, OprD family [Pontibacter sp. JH31]|uniref:Outer membrane porin, OprD family n=2 Tax=Pontibacter aquaedesilientis TaxID=2766980 RepID=A0ABR7XDS5_9BACT|nr:outer membrane porin, OprD family [Pontibacter aquaedesilientis]
MKLVLPIALLCTLGWNSAAGQDHHTTDQGHGTEQEADTIQINSVKELFTKGEVNGHIRNHFMATFNHRTLSDNYANAIGAEIGYKTASLYGFRFGFAGLFTYNLFSSDIWERDFIAEKHPKFELELFDIEDPHNKADLDRLDEIYLAYNAKHLRAKVGRFSFTSPLMNPQDTRMKPYSFQGIKVQIPFQEKGQITFAWFDHFSPRSTVEWFKADETIGIFSPGVDEFGNPSDYPHHTSTKGVAVAGLELHPNKRLKAEAWNYWIENVSNNSYGKAVVAVAPQVKLGVEGLYQFQVGDGGNPKTQHVYFPEQRQWLAGGMLAYELNNLNLSLNYLHIDGDGRFLFPREWGREQFFATLSRGRMEGVGKADLLVAKAHKHWSGNFSSELALARSWLPEPTDYRYNKYGAVSYWGWVADLKYSPAKPVLDGLSFRLLYIGRESPGTGIPLKDRYYNTNFHHLNFVTQITF